MGLKHRTLSGESGNGNASLVQPADWNDNHDFVPFLVLHLGVPIAASFVWTDMPNAATPFRGNDQIIPVDLTYADELRLQANVAVAGSASAVLDVQYSTSGTGSWVSLGINLAINSTGLKVSSWTSLPSGAKADVWLRIVGSGGDGATDPQFGSIFVHAR